MNHDQQVAMAMHLTVLTNEETANRRLIKFTLRNLQAYRVCDLGVVH